jgi:RHH-type proline utilization regulon transcriptional repressor/proline dehydrogenase/delta 1-pyrroline-5-carboxylate dehydrogenase
MGYFVRRLLENTSNESFLRHTFFDEKQVDELLKNPAEVGGGSVSGERSLSHALPSPSYRNGSASIPRQISFENEEEAEFEADSNVLHHS